MYNTALLLCTPAIVLLAACNQNQRKSEESDKPIDAFAIAYNVLVNDSTDNYEVYTMNMDGSGTKNITNLSGVEWTYYSYKENLYFLSDKDTCQRCAYYLYQTDYKGEKPRKVSDIQLADSWMSGRNNGTELIVRPHVKVDSAFYIIDLYGNLVGRLETGLPSFSDPVFIDHGKKVVFRGATKKSKREENYQEEIYVINTDGTNLTQLTHYPQSDTTAPWYAYKAGPPKLNPAENYITYQSFQNGKYSLYAVTPDGSRQWKLTDNLQNEGWHDWSPDGKWLAVELFDTDQTQFHIGLMNWDTKEMKVLTDNTFTYQQSPNFILKTRD